MNIIDQTKAFGVYHWDTFDNVPLLIDEFDILSDARAFVIKRWDGRITSNGADQVDIVNIAGVVIESHKIT